MIHHQPHPQLELGRPSHRLGRCPLCWPLSYSQSLRPLQPSCLLSWPLQPGSLSSWHLWPVIHSSQHLRPGCHLFWRLCLGSQLHRLLRLGSLWFRSLQLSCMLSCLLRLGCQLSTSGQASSLLAWPSCRVACCPGTSGRAAS
jgi:hypothetical protein